MLNYFIWKGTSSTEFDLACSNPAVVVPVKNANRIEIPGRSGFLSMDTNSYAPITKTMECRLLSDERMDALATWLSGSGQLILSSQPERCFEATVNSAVSIEYILKRYRSFTVSFDCQPFQYDLNHRNHLITLTQSPAAFFGKGNIASEPVITLHGSGSATLTVNGNEITLKSISPHITLNSEIMDAYKNGANANNQMTGDFPSLNPAGHSNTLSFTGNVSKIEIKPNWRWL